MVVQALPVCSSTVVVAIDVGKTEFAFSVTDASRTLLLKPRTGCPMSAWAPSTPQPALPTNKNHHQLRGPGADHLRPTPDLT